MRYGPLPPSNLPQQDTARMLLMAERWQRSSTMHNLWAPGAKKAVDFFEGRQWTEDALAEMRKQKRPALTFNIIAPLIRLILGYQRSQKTDIIFRPGHDGRSSEDVATALSQIEKAISLMNKSQFIDTEVFMDGLVAGRGYWRSKLCFEKNDLGDVNDRALDPFSVYLDPDADTYDLNESAAFIQVSKYLSIDQIEDTYGKIVGELLRPFTNGKTPLSPVTSHVVNDEITPVRYFGQREDSLVDYWDHFFAQMGDFVDTARKSIRVIETEHVVRQDANVAIDLETGDRKVLPDDWGPERIAKLQWYAEQMRNPIVIQRRKVKRLWVTVTAGDMILYDRPSPYDTFSVIPYFPYFRRGITRGAVDDLIDPQLEKNKRRSIEIEMVMKTSNGGWSYNQDSLTPKQKANLRNFGSSPGFMLEWKGEKEPKQIAPAAPPTAHERLENKADQDLRMISGINESSLGQMDARVQSGRAIEAKQRQAVIAVQMYFDNFSRSKQLQGEKHLELYQNHYTEERLFRVLGEDGSIVTRQINRLKQGVPATDEMGGPIIDQQGNPVLLDPETGNPFPPGVTKVIENDITVGKYIAVVDDSPMSANFLNAQFEEMMGMMEKMGPAMAPFIPAFADLMIDQSTLPRKDEWKERFKTIAPAILGFDPTTGQAPAPQGGAPGQPVPATDEAGNPILDEAGNQIMLDPATGQPIQQQLPAPGAAAPAA